MKILVCFMKGIKMNSYTSYNTINIVNIKINLLKLFRHAINEYFPQEHSSNTFNFFFNFFIGNQLVGFFKTSV